MLEEAVFTVKQLAARWSCSVDVVYDMLRSGELKGFKVGNAWRIGRPVVDRYENTIKEEITWL